MDFRLFSSQHFEEYCSWFEEEELNRWLGPKPDIAWLKYVLEDQTGQQYSVFKEGEIVAVVGIVFPIGSHPYCVITDIAVCPKQKGKGIGKTVINQLLQLYPQTTFKTFVEVKNFKAIAFFESLGWEKTEEVDEDGMWLFVHDVTNRSSIVS